MCIACQLDANRTDAFANFMTDVLQKGALGLMISIGHRTALFDTMNALGPMTLQELAKKTNLSQRYVREWLGAMVTGGIVDIDETGTYFTLPKEHAQMLTRANPADNMAVHTQYLSVLGSVEDQVVECFEKGGGVSYDQYPRFHEVMAEDSGQTIGSNIFDKVIPMVEGLEDRLRKGIDVLDIGCGRARVLIKMAKEFPNSRFVGYDLSTGAIKNARAFAKEHGVENVSFEVQDLTHFHKNAVPNTFDFITAFDAIHDQARPDHVLQGIARSLRPTGIFLMQDIAGSSDMMEDCKNPMAAFLYTISCMHCMTVSLAQGGMGVGAMWGRGLATRMLKHAGFTNVSVNQLDHDPLNYYYVVDKA